MLQSEEEKLALYYERVSTNHEEQNESMENQRALAKSYLKRHPEISLAEPLDTYSERVSGKSDERPKYQLLLKRLERGDIRYVMVKDFKRLNRSTEVSAQLGNYAKMYHFQFILLSTGQIIDPNSEQNRMMYGFESLMNQEVVYRQSEYGRLAHRQKCEAKRLNRNNILFGYLWDSEKKDIIINQEQASIIRTMFDLYVFRDYGIVEIRRYLETKGYTYSSNTVIKWLTETAYIGIFHLNKKGSELGVGSGMKTKRYMNPKDEWIAVERPDLAIVDKRIFDLAQKIRENRREFFSNEKVDENGNRIKMSRQDRFRGIHLFSSKIVCAECGYTYLHAYSDRNKSIGIYKDSYTARSKKLLSECSNKEYKRLYEEDLTAITVTIINGLIEKNKDCIPTLLNILREVMLDDSYNREERVVRQQTIKRLKELLTKIQDRFIYAEGELLEALNQKYKDVQKQIYQLEEENAEENQQKEKFDEIENRFTLISEAIQKWSVIDTESVDRKVVNTFIDKMIIHADGKLEVYLNTNESFIYTIPKKHKRKSSNGSSTFFAEKMDYPRQEKMVQKYATGVRLKSALPLFEFGYGEKIGNRRTHIKRKFHVFVMVEV